MDAVVSLMKKEGVSFSSDSKDPYSLRCWRLFRMLQWVLPVTAVVSGRPVSVYGAGSCRLDASGDLGKFRYRYSKAVSDAVLKEAEDLPFGGSCFEDSFCRLFDTAVCRDDEDSALLEAGSLLTIDLNG
jgi:hypothetical protein